MKILEIFWISKCAPLRYFLIYPNRDKFLIERTIKLRKKIFFFLVFFHEIFGKLFFQIFWICKKSLEQCWVCNLDVMYSDINYALQIILISLFFASKLVWIRRGRCTCTNIPLPRCHEKNERNILFLLVFLPRKVMVFRWQQGKGLLIFH